MNRDDALGVAAKVKGAGLSIATPTCSVAGKTIDNGADARCFAAVHAHRRDARDGRQDVRTDAALRLEGRQGHERLAAAITFPNGVGMPNPNRNVWITETAISTALNTSYMAEQISLFGIAVGGAFLLVGLVLGLYSLGGLRMPAIAPARPRPAREQVPA